MIKIPSTASSELAETKIFISKRQHHLHRGVTVVITKPYKFAYIVCRMYQGERITRKPFRTLTDPRMLLPLYGGDEGSSLTGQPEVRNNRSTVQPFVCWATPRFHFAAFYGL
jgi:hypothetical protein